MEETLAHFRIPESLIQELEMVTQMDVWLSLELNVDRAAEVV